jgi:hypothetical protein
MVQIIIHINRIMSCTDNNSCNLIDSFYKIKILIEPTICSSQKYYCHINLNSNTRRTFCLHFTPVGNLQSPIRRPSLLTPVIIQDKWQVGIKLVNILVATLL